MSKKIRLFAVTAMLLFAAQCFAQINLGAKAGVNFATMTSEDDENNYAKDTPYKMKLGVHFGLTASYLITPNLGLESALLFSTKGHKMHQTGVNYTINENYIEIPVHLVYSMELGGINVFVKGGPYLGYAISGKFKADKAVLGANNDQNDEKMLIGSDEEKDDLKALDYGVNVGAGAEINGISVGLQYGLGLANVAPYNQEFSYKRTNRVIGLSIGYKLGSM